MNDEEISSSLKPEAILSTDAASKLETAKLHETGPEDTNPDVPIVKPGLKNVKAITRITYSAEEPRNYWAQYGYSSYDEI